MTKNALKFIKMPVTPVDYSFVNNIGKNAMIGGYDTSKKGSKEFNPSLLTRDFSKYTLMDRFLVLSKYQNIQKIIKDAKQKEDAAVDAVISTLI